MKLLLIQKSLSTRSFGFALSACFFASSCATTPPPGMEGNIIGQSEYEQILDLNSKNIGNLPGAL